MVVAKISCVEINKRAEIKLTYDNLYDTLHKILGRRITEEDYESCHQIKILLDKIPPIKFCNNFSFLEPG